MPFNLHRFKRLCELKRTKQTLLAKRAGVAQSQVSECGRGIGPTVELLERLATALDCSTDFLLNRTFLSADDSDVAFRAVVSGMAFDVFAARLNVTEEQRQRCQRVLAHKVAPLTADDWAILSEQIELALGPFNGSRSVSSFRGSA